MSVDNEDEIIYENISLGYLQDIIESKYATLLSLDKRSKQYKEYKNIYNSIINIYNTKAKAKIYTIIK